MIDRPTTPLEIASRVLKPETIREIRDRGFSNSAFVILDRWALISPDQLKLLEQQGGMALQARLAQQQMIEKRTLTTESARQAKLRGVTDWEILELAGIDTDLKIAA